MWGIASILFVGFLSVLWANEHSTSIPNWPPQVGQEYPDLELFDKDGNQVRLSQFKGKVLLIEPVGMDCPACQALTGAHIKGPLGSVKPQPRLKSIEEYFPKYTKGLQLTDERIVFIQIIYYNALKHEPTKDEVNAWVSHFDMERSSNFRVFGAPKKYKGKHSLEMVPGFHLVDKNFILRADGAGHRPKHNIYTELLPMVKSLL